MPGSAQVFLIVGIFRELRSLPSVIPRNLNFVVCRFVQQKKKCQFLGPGPCQFAHSEEERVLWIWMARNRGERCQSDSVIKQTQWLILIIMLIITEICKVPTLWLKALNKHNMTRIMSIETENIMSNLTKANT